MLVVAIDDAVNNGGKVLVHCQAGVSRSSTIAIAYVMTRLSMRMFDAFRFVKAQRAVVAPNFNFLGQLLELETTLASDVVGFELPQPLGITCSNL